MLLSQIACHIYFFVPTKTTVKLANENTKYSQEIGNILCCFHNCPIIYRVGQFYYCPGHLSNTISSYALNYSVLKRLHINVLNIVIFLTLKGVLGDRRTRYKKIYLQIEIVKSNTKINRNFVVQTVCALTKQNLIQLIHEHFDHVSIVSLKRITRKVLVKGLPKNIPDF